MFWPAHKNSIKSCKTPVHLTFYVTNKCNSRCSHCYYNSALNRTQQELTLEEIKTIFGSFKNKIANILITGGEPFMREDLAEICIFLSKNKIARVIDIASNGLDTENICAAIETILRKASYSEIHLGISLDGARQTHELIRGVPGAYARTLETLARLKPLQEKHKNFFLAVVTTICEKNRKEILPLIDFVKDSLGLRHSLAFIRSTKEDCFNNNLPLRDYSPLDPGYKNLPLAQAEELNRIIDARVGAGSLLNKLEALRRRCSLKIIKEKKKIFPCVASQISAAIYPNADVALCNFTVPLGNLRDYGFDFYKIWNSEPFIKNRQAVTTCACTWPRNLITSLCYDFDSVKKLVV